MEGITVSSGTIQVDITPVITITLFPDAKCVEAAESEAVSNLDVLNLEMWCNDIECRTCSSSSSLSPGSPSWSFAVLPFHPILILH